jgi:DNA-binding transcriptional MerR regulator
LLSQKKEIAAKQGDTTEIAPGFAPKGVPIWAWRAAVPGKGQRAERRLLRISELAALTEVPPASIKFYIKEGLLPPPVKTSRNMAYYDETFVEKIRLIKELQAHHFLPLRVIRDIINQNNGNGSIEETKALLDLKGYLLGRPIGDRKDPLPEKEVIRQYNTYEEELESLRRMRIVTPWQEGDERMYGGDDLDFLEALENNRRLGFTREIGFQVEDLEIYLKNLDHGGDPSPGRAGNQRARPAPCGAAAQDDPQGPRGAWRRRGDGGRPGGRERHGWDGTGSRTERERSFVRRSGSTGAVA